MYPREDKPFSRARGQNLLNRQGLLTTPGFPMSLLCPIDYRYGRAAMKNLFVEETRLQRLLDVEAALARAHAKVGTIPAAAAKEIAAKATTKVVSVERVLEIE